VCGFAIGEVERGLDGDEGDEGGYVDRSDQVRADAGEQRLQALPARYEGRAQVADALAPTLEPGDRLAEGSLDHRQTALSDGRQMPLHEEEPHLVARQFPP